MNRACKICGTEFETTRNKLYCSKPCLNESKRLNNKKHYYENKTGVKSNFKYTDADELLEVWKKYNIDLDLLNQIK